MNNSNSLYDLLKQIENDNKRQCVYNQYINFAMAKKRIPYNVSLELLPICNFDCQMCYIRMSFDEFVSNGHSLLRFDDWKYYIDGMCELGTGSFSLSGGECMLHPDFIKIYEYIYDLGKFVSLITNCSSLNDEIFELFLKKPPSAVYVTVYGGSEETYNTFCKNGKAYYLVVQNIDRLLQANIPVHLMCTLGKGNICDKKKIEDFANSRNMKVDFSAALMGYGKCDKQKLEKAQLDIFETFEDKRNLTSLKDDVKFDSSDYYKNYVFPKMDNIIIRKKGIMCSSAKNKCSISWRGTMRPCVTFEPFILDPRTDGGFRKCWEKIVEWGDNVPLIEECQICLFRSECTTCLAHHYNDIHEFGKPSPRFCFKVQHPEEAAKLQAEYDRRQAEKANQETNNATVQGDLS